MPFPSGGLEKQSPTQRISLSFPSLGEICFDFRKGSGSDFFVLLGNKRAAESLWNRIVNSSLRQVPCQKFYTGADPDQFEKFNDVRLCFLISLVWSNNMKTVERWKKEVMLLWKHFCNHLITGDPKAFLEKRASFLVNKTICFFGNNRLSVLNRPWRKFHDPRLYPNSIFCLIRITFKTYRVKTLLMCLVDCPCFQLQKVNLHSHSGSRGTSLYP